VTTSGRLRRCTALASYLVLAGALLAGALVAGTAGLAGAQGDSATGRGAASHELPPGGGIRLIATSTWLDPDGEISVAVALDPSIPDDATVEVTVHEALRHRTDFRQTLDRSRLGGRLTQVSLGTVGDLDSTAGTTQVTARIPIRSAPPVPDEPPRLGIANPGVHPVDVSVIDPDGTVLGGIVTYVVRPPLDPVDNTSKIVLVQPFDAPPSHAVDGSATIERDIRERWTVNASALTGEPAIPVVVAPRPETLDSLTAGGPLDRALVDQLADLAASGTMPENTYVSVDLDGALRAGLEADLDDVFRRGGDTLAASFGSEPAQGLWVADSGLTTLSLRWLVERGIDTLVVPHEALAPLDTDDPHERPTGRPVRLSAAGASGAVALTTDPLLQQHAGSSGDPVLDAQRLVADLALDWFDDPGTPRSLTVVLREDTDPAFVESLRQLLAASPLLEVVTPVDAVASTPLATIEGPTGTTRLLTRRLAADAGTNDLTQLRQDLDLARLTISSVRSVFPDDPALFARYDTLLAILLSDDLTQADRSSRLVELASEMDVLLDGIDLPERRAITLPARDGTIPITLTNTSGRAARVAVLLESDKLLFVNGPRMEIALPEGTTTLEIEVQARASGAFPLAISLESPHGDIELGSAQYTVRSTAVSGLGLAISAAAIVVLGVWWVRTSRRARSEHAAGR
jgi:hypothetical protein